MEQLDAAKRLLIESYYSDDQSLRELAKQQGRSYDAVRKAVYRAAHLGGLHRVGVASEGDGRMSRHAPVSHSSREEIYRLASAVLARDISAAEFQRFEHLVTHNAAACDWYVEFMCDAYNLRTHPKLGPANTANPPITVFPSDDNSDVTQRATAPPVLGLLGGAWHGTVGYFSSGWPLAYLVATAIFGVGLLIGSRIYVSQPEQIAGNRRCPAGRSSSRRWSLSVESRAWSIASGRPHVLLRSATTALSWAAGLP